MVFHRFLQIWAKILREESLTAFPPASGKHSQRVTPLSPALAAPHDLLRQVFRLRNPHRKPPSRLRSGILAYGSSVTAAGPPGFCTPFLVRLHP